MKRDRNVRWGRKEPSRFRGRKEPSRCVLQNRFSVAVLVILGE